MRVRQGVPSPRGRDTLTRAGRVPRAVKRRRQDYKRWQREAPMQLWQMDVTGSVFLADGTELKLISGLDDHSRFCVIATVVRRATARAVCRAFVSAMAAYGVPGEIVTVITDNNSFRLVIDGEAVGVVPRATSREIGRYKAYATHPGRR